MDKTHHSDIIERGLCFGDVRVTCALQQVLINALNWKQGTRLDIKSSKINNTV